MTNYNKKGYSTSEIAQILGCTVSTVHNMINGHKLGAMIIDPKTPNGRKTIRITREHLQDFIKANPRRFSDAEKRTWGVGVETEASKPEKVSAAPNYSVLVNGRIAVSGITTALLNDTGNAVFDDISIKVMK